IKRLEEEGLVQRAPDPTDSRSSLISTTPQGVAQLGACRPHLPLGVGGLLEDLPAEDVATLARAAQIPARQAEAPDDCPAGPGRRPAPGPPDPPAARPVGRPALPPPFPEGTRMTSSVRDASAPTTTPRTPLTPAASSPSGPTLREAFRQPKAVWAIAFAATVSFMGIGLVDPILPAISEQLEASPSQTMLLFTSYLFVTAITMFFTSWFAAKLGTKRTLLIGLLLVVAFAALAGAAGSVTEIIGL